MRGGFLERGASWMVVVGGAADRLAVAVTRAIGKENHGRRHQLA